MVKRLFNLLFDFVDDEKQSPLRAADNKVLSFPHSHPEKWVAEEMSAIFIQACRDGNMFLVTEILKRDSSFVDATQYLPSYAVEGSIPVHRGDGIDCMTAVQACVIARQPEILHLLVTMEAQIPDTSIQRASADGNVAALEIMLPLFINQMKDRELSSIETITHALVTACSGGHREVANYLLDHGALLKGTRDFHTTGNPLSEAMMSGNTDLVKDLLHRGADVNAYEVRLCEQYYDVNTDAVALVVGHPERQDFQVTINARGQLKDAAYCQRRAKDAREAFAMNADGLISDAQDGNETLVKDATYWQRRSKEAHDASPASRSRPSP